MNKLSKKNLLVLLIAGILLAGCFNPVKAEDKTRDIFTIHNKDYKYRYYSSPPDSVYQLPEGFYNIKTVITDTVNPVESKEGDKVNFRVIEPLKLADFFTIPAGSTINGEILKITYPKKFIKSSKVVISFDKLTAPGGFVVPLKKHTIQVCKFVAKTGTRYELGNEIWYGMVFGGGKYPVSRFLNTPISYAIGGGAGLVGGLVYGTLAGDIPKHTGLGVMRGLGGKSIYNIGFLNGRNFVIEQNTPILLTIDARKVEDMRYKPQYLNLEQLMMASAFNNDRYITEELISKASINSNVSDVIRYYEESVSNNPDNLENQINLGKTYIESARYQKAITHFNLLLETGNTDSEVYYNLAISYEKAGNLDKAKLNYEKAIETNYPENEVYLKLANLLKKMGFFEESIKYIDKYNSLMLAKS